jgi:hypothetical protein
LVLVDFFVWFSLTPFLCLFPISLYFGDQKLQYADVPEDIEPEEIRPMGNYAVQITWPDGFSQVT